MISGSIHVRARSPQSLKDALDRVEQQLNNLLGFSDKAVAVVKVEEFKQKRSTRANKLYWVWLSKIASELNRRGLKIEVWGEDGDESTKSDFDSSDVHDLMRIKFLGFEGGKRFGTLSVPKKIRSTRKLNVAEFCHYLNQIHAWAENNLGVILDYSNESEYAEYLAKQVS